MSKDKDKNEKKTGFWATIKRILGDERTKFAVGIVLILFTIFCTMAMTSYLFTGSDDKSVVESYALLDENIKQQKDELGLFKTSADLNAKKQELAELRAQTKNWTGFRGAYFAEFMINKSFGLGSFALLWFLLVLSLHFMQVHIQALWKSFVYAAFLTVWISLFLDFCFGSLLNDTFFALGGAHGNFIDTFLCANLGLTGTLLILIGTGILFAVFAFSAALPAIQRWLHIKQDDTEAPAEEPTEQTEETETTETSEDETSIIIVEPTNETENNNEEDKNDVPTDDWVIVEPTNETDEPTEESEVEEKEKENEPLIDIVTTTTENDPKWSGVPDKYDPLKEQGPYDPKADLPNYKYPTIDLLKDYGQQAETLTKEEQLANQQRIISTLKNYGIGIKKIYETIGPTITLYEIVPDDGVRISKIQNLEKDIMLSLAAIGIRIIAPIPGKGTIGIEVPNSHPRIVPMFDTIASKKFQESKYELPVAIGRTITNEVFMFDLAKLPHLLVAGATGQGKSVGLNAIITSLLYKKHPSQLKFVLIDPKKVEFNIYSDIENHFLAKLPDAEEPVITDVDKVKQTLNSVCKEMDQRYDLLKAAHMRNIVEYNERFISRQLSPKNGHRFLPYIVVIVDEFGDLIMTAGKEVEQPIARIAQLARAVGIHMVIATQRPSVNIITGSIKANFPARLAFRVASVVDSKTILDASGAQQLIGRGDLLFSKGDGVTRVQCAFVDTPEVENVVHFIGNQTGYGTALILPEPDMPDGESAGAVDLSKRDEKFNEVARWVVESQVGSTSMVQRKFEVGFNRAGKLMDQLEAAGIVGPVCGSKPRQVLVHSTYDLENILKML